MSKHSTVVLLVAVGFVGCVKTRTQLREEATDAPLQKQTVSQQKAEAAAPKPLPTPARLDEYDDQMRQFHGRVDSLENSVNQLSAAQANEKQSVTKMAEAIDQKFLTYEEEIKKLKSEIQELRDSQGKGKSVAATATSAGDSPAGGKKRTSFDEGEDLFKEKSWKEAIVAYQKYRDSFPKGRVYAEATYKIGVCFQELKMKDEAKAFLEEVVAKYPNSREAKKASLRIKSLK